MMDLWNIINDDDDDDNCRKYSSSDKSYVINGDISLSFKLEC